MLSELTEITEPADAVPFRGWIFYDGDCAFCGRLARRFEPVFARRGFRFEPLQQEWVLRPLKLTRDEALEEMRLVINDGEVFGGADAVIQLAREVWWAAPLALLARIPFVHSLLGDAYRWVAARRTCAIARHPLGGTGFRTSHFPESAPAERQKVGRSEARRSENGHDFSLVVRTRWIGLVALPLAALGTRSLVPAWAFMWLMACALFIGCKWLTLGRAIQRTLRVGAGRAAAYLLAWPGMDAARFLSPALARPLPWLTTLKQAAPAAGRILLGAFLFFVAARRAPDPMFAAWIGMVGMILILHFGLFDLLSVAWRTARVDAPPLMNRPLRSRSVSEFWGRRWNAAFSDLTLQLVFRPMARRAGILRATWLAFAVSGLIHELVISLPAGGGFGLPTAYFLTQALWLSIERSSVANLLRLDRPFPGWLFTMLVVAGPAYWLFHPLFIRRVILPFMEAIRAL